MAKSPEAVKDGAKGEEDRKMTEEGVKLRRAQANNKRKGEAVWFSRRVENGRLHHWAIIIDDRRYELRLPSGDTIQEKPPKNEQADPNLYPLHYEARVIPWTLAKEMKKLRALNLATAGNDYYISQIGWTTLPKGKIEGEYESALSSIGVDLLSYNDCQIFLKDFTGRIIKRPEGCALDYDWFAENLDTPHHKLHEIHPEKGIQAFQSSLQKTMWGAAGVGAAGIYGAYQAEDAMNSAHGSALNGYAVADGACYSCGSCVYFPVWDCCWLCPCAGGC